MKVYQYYIAWSPDKGDVAKYLRNATIDDNIKVEDLVLNVINQLSSHQTHNNTKYALYAWTNNKNIANIFEHTYDMNIFRKVVHKYSKDEFIQFQHECEDVKYMLTEDYPMYLTNTEREYLSDALMMSLESDLTSVSGNYPYEFILDKYIRHLDLLLYCTFWNFACGDTDFVSSNWSYGCTVEGYGSSLRLKPNTIACFVHYFYILLNKDTRIGVK